MESQFKHWKCRSSSLGHILTVVNNISAKQKEQIKKLQTRKDDPKQNALTPAMEDTLKTLIAQRDKPDVLPQGVETHLDNVFRSEFWGRRRLLFNKFLDKGNLCEDDSIGLKSQIDGFFYTKNEDHFENAFIKGTPDNIQENVKDIKSNYDQETFDKAELTSLYEWQVKAYIWLMLNNKVLTSWRGKLVYCLVNNPIHQIINEKNSLFYKMGQPEVDDEKYVEAVRQTERNMIYDIEAHKKNYPNYFFENAELDFDIPAILRIKEFEVVLNTRDINLIKRRVKMCREYLMNKEQDILDKIKAYESTRKA